MSDLQRIDPKLLSSLCSRLETQVKSYHRHYHMGSNTSVPSETARELLESLVYTAAQSPGGDLETGQDILHAKLCDAKELCRLVQATAPEWQSQYRWETITQLYLWLEQYDLLHFAHRIPNDLDYPLLVSVPEDLLGIDWVLFFLIVFGRRISFFMPWGMPPGAAGSSVFLTIGGSL